MVKPITVEEKKSFVTKRKLAMEKEATYCLEETIGIRIQSNGHEFSAHKSMHSE